MRIGRGQGADIDHGNDIAIRVTKGDTFSRLIVRQETEAKRPDWLIESEVKVVFSIRHNSVREHLIWDGIPEGPDDGARIERAEGVPAAPVMVRLFDVKGMVTLAPIPVGPMSPDPQLVPGKAVAEFGIGSPMGLVARSKRVGSLNTRTR